VAKLEENSKKIKENARSSLRPTYPQAQEEGRPYHFPSYTLSSNNQANERKKCTSRLENDKRGLEIATKLPPRGLEVLCVSLWGSQEPSTISDTPVKTASFAC
jgi:hypothetical protein